ncbi:glycosyltransferase family 39 protein [Afipia massiliensis]|uniref:Glycosyltransferase family 39 protein n=1 Tax=Afipia massiliensis TaxID=211460 RepID=A0A4U6BR01_9BRAD|nr:glycosyltransferase family 39 protein [Afipia massiliensis]TKT72922.1 glycosyltransferase family 39 protein [Afipia massiliensis]
MASFLDTWLDGVEDGWSIPVLLAVFVTLWTAFLAIAYLNADLHPDVIEAWTIGRTLDWGGAKHPPLMGWVTHAWTLVFPVADWSFYLLAMVNSALALWIIDLTTRRFTNGDKRVIVLLLLMLLPVYQFQAQRFNANSVLFAVWPLAIYCFLRSFETRRAGWAAAAGLAGALAILGKYYSAFLIVGFIFAAVLHPARRIYFTSSAPWISAAAGLLLLAPHVHWMLTSGTSPLGYALAAHGGLTTGRAFLSGLAFLLGLAATLALPGFMWAVMIRTRAGDYLRDFRLLDPGLLLLLLVAIGAIIVPPVVSLMLRSSLTTVWASPGLFVFVLVAVCAARFPVDRTQTRRLAASILAVTLVAVLLAPAHAYYRNGHPFKEGRNYYSRATTEVMRRWRQVSPSLLKTVSGDRLAMALTFYAPVRPAFVLPFTQRDGWQIPSDAVLREGWASMCLPDEEACLQWLKQIAATSPDAKPFDFVVQPQLWGIAGVPARITALVVPPRAAR